MADLLADEIESLLEADEAAMSSTIQQHKGKMNEEENKVRNSEMKCIA